MKPKQQAFTTRFARKLTEELNERNCIKFPPLGKTSMKFYQAGSQTSIRRHEAKTEERKPKITKTSPDFFPGKAAPPKPRLKKPKALETKTAMEKLRSNMQYTSNKIMALISGLYLKEGNGEMYSKRYATNHGDNHPRHTSLMPVPKLADFVPCSTLGSGHFAEVKLAKWKSFFNLPCALKVIPKKAETTTSQPDHLLNEKNLLMSLKHPYIVKW